MKCIVVLLVAAAIAGRPLSAKRLAVRTYTTADGLARDNVLCAFQDSHGFLWFCTAEGLSRFDGYQFKNYYTAQGLPTNTITSFIETRSGSYWVGTTGGVCRFDPAAAAGSHFRCSTLKDGEKVRTPLVLYEDRRGTLWCGAGESTPSSTGLFRLRPDSLTFEPVDLPMNRPVVTALANDASGALWVGSADGLYRRDPNGKVTRYSKADGLPGDYIMALLQDRAGRLWIGTRDGLGRMVAGQPSTIRSYSTADGLPADRIESLFQSADGVVWAGTALGLAQSSAGGPREFHGYTIAEGLSGRASGALTEDRDGNLWAATFGSGVMKILRDGFITFTAADGVPWARAFVESRSGELITMIRENGAVSMGRFDGARFRTIHPAWPRSMKYFGWGSGQIGLQDRDGEWWIATGEGLARFPPVTRVEELTMTVPKAVYTRQDGFPGNDIFRIFEDKQGNIWVGVSDGGVDPLARWDRATQRPHVFSRSDGLPPEPMPTAFAEDRGGDLWIGLYHESLARFRNGRFTTYTLADGLPGAVESLYVDSAGRLWIAGSRGLSRVDDPARDRISFRTYGSSQGLSSDFISDITEDRWGRFYAATGRGVDSFEPQSDGLGRVKHYTAADGLSPGQVELAYRDAAGDLWFATPLGVSRLTPRRDPPLAPVPVLVTGISIGGVPYPISEAGESSITALRFPLRPIRFDFVGISYSPGETLRYQYMLEGADVDWSTPSDQRSVIYANLSPHRYRFLARAVNSEGAVSVAPATIVFAIPPPFWQTGWFISTAAVAALLLLYGAHRYRVSRLLAVAAVRARIANDLHDDIATSLSQIVILSEVGQRAADVPERSARGTLGEIAEISREVLDSLSDIVWAINPDNDHLTDLVYRMRRFSGDLLAGHKIALEFRSSFSEHDLRLGPYVRRQVFLVFKEAIHNIVRHSAATKVEVGLARLDNRLILHCRDNGRGFDSGAEFEGRGLINMQKRAASLGAGLKLQSSPGEGSVLEMEIRLTAPRTLAALRGK
ncbi:MAG TPA: two-component regulator propeller domain-containing protein [Bryobacteraceae bacterium]|nr:two-component regulator propeller domain-containing protein [Bryobacteraceae bacterium]